MASARDAILSVAARHFAEHGFAGASLREIMRDAKVNLASVHYHFGSKEAVYREAIAPYMTRLSAARLATLEKLEQRAAAMTAAESIEQLIRGYVEPHIRLCAEPEASDYVRLLARFTTENGQLTKVIYNEHLAPVRGRYVSAFAAAAPQIPEAVLARLFSFMVSLMVTAPADSSYESLTDRSPWPAKPAELADQIVAFVTAGLVDAAARYTSPSRHRAQKPAVQQVIGSKAKGSKKKITKP